MAQFENIATSIITGFLGAGKTTAIRYLLQHKPEDEPWAVIVNEFGQVGIDGALLKNDGVEISEIPGGCLCCVGSQSFSVGLNRIIRQIRPRRILIEPTGLGHPARLLENLRGEYYRSVLDLKAVICLLDARQLADPRYTENTNFIDQIKLADILLANKADTYSDQDRQAFQDFARQCNPPKDRLALLEQGRIPPDWLNLTGRHSRQADSPHAHEHLHQGTQITESQPRQGWLRIDSYSEHGCSLGWQIEAENIFSQQKLHTWIRDSFELPHLQRIKAVLHTDKGWLSVNATRGEITLESMGAQQQSKLELIADGDLPADKLDKSLLELLAR